MYSTLVFPISDFKYSAYQSHWSSNAYLMSLFEDEFQCKEEDEVSIPRASLNKFIKDVVPDARLTTETRELLLNCCHAFIHKLATQANIACASAKKKTISPEHIFQGLDAMNLSAYKERVVVASEEAKEELKGRRMLSASYRFKHQDSEELERLAREQQEIFEQARADFVGEQLDRGDLLLASELAAADAAALQGPVVGSSADNPTKGMDTNCLAYSSLHPAGDAQPIPKLTGSERILGTVTVEDDDNYDD
ncbi:Protein Dr1 [Clonorchis sinensis]|uniref:Protein Dr1 n=1 Tax=Clonorchis sinensis TaxID=79923 RepID=A0A8T1MVM6_CLOSI|nr:Protein Dr1 [Clonorchis sinensis]